MNTLHCPVPILQQLLHALAEHQPRAAFLAVGTQHTPPDRRWLVRGIVFVASDTLPPQREPMFGVASISDPTAMLSIRVPHVPWPPGLVGQLYLGHGPWRGFLWGSVRADASIEPLHDLALVGAGMHVLRIGDRPHQDATFHPSFSNQHAYAMHTRWSRTIGALGGEGIWERLTRLRIAVIGCGRTGSFVAVTLARLGIPRLTLIDPDLIEPHNLGEMDAVTDADLGRPKAEALADHLRALIPHPLASPLPVVTALRHPEARVAATACDVLVCCCDNDAARLTTAVLATLYHRILIDIGSGIFFDIPTAPHQPGHRTMGADVRLIVPGDGCLLCRGHLTDYAQAVTALVTRGTPPPSQFDWHRQRAGSLRTLNQIAAGLAVQMLQDLVAERLRASTWAQLEISDTGRLSVQYPPSLAAMRGCALCAKAGRGMRDWG
jgi:ThiF family